jgi:hypothetical protein
MQRQRCPSAAAHVCRLTLHRARWSTAVSVPTHVILMTAFSLLVYPSHQLAQYIFHMCIDCVTKSCG